MATGPFGSDNDWGALLDFSVRAPPGANHDLNIYLAFFLGLMWRLNLRNWPGLREGGSRRKHQWGFGRDDCWYRTLDSGHDGFLPSGELRESIFTPRLGATATCYDATRSHGEERSATQVTVHLRDSNIARVKSRAQSSQCHMTVRHWGIVGILAGDTDCRGDPRSHLLTAMGKRKKSSRKIGPKKKREPLGSVNRLFFPPHIPMNYLPETTFTCLFCHHDNSVTVKLDRKECVAQLLCKVCGQSFQSKVNRTSCTRM